MILLGVLLIVIGLIIAVPILFWIGVVVLILGVFAGFGGYGWYYPRRRVY